MTRADNKQNSKQQDSLDVIQMTRKMKQLDDRAYRWFFKLYYRRLWAYLVVVSKGNGNEIDDILQLTFTKVVKNIQVFKTEQELWAWLSVVARNTYRDYQRKQRGFLGLLDRYKFTAEAADELQRNDNPVDSSLNEDSLDRALHRLSAKELCLVKLKYFQGSSYRQIATTLGVTEKAVESRLARTRGKLRMMLLEEAGNE